MAATRKPTRKTARKTTARKSTLRTSRSRAGNRTTKRTTQTRRTPSTSKGGVGRREEVGRSGVYPASGPLPPDNAPYQGMGSFGQGERGAEGYNDSGSSEVFIVHKPAKSRPNQQGSKRSGGA